MNEQIRLSDAERDEAARVLGEHYAQGRLTAEEHQDRQDRLFSARTYADLPPLFHDLPGGSPLHPTPVPPPRPAPHAVGRPGRRGGPSPARLVRVLALVLLAVVILTHLPVILAGLVLWWLAGSLFWGGAFGRGCRAPKRRWA
ncbi:MAG: DUF1707 domain-containing protein [Nocardioidaceae bacterium]